MLQEPPWSCATKADAAPTPPPWQRRRDGPPVAPVAPCSQEPTCRDQAAQPTAQLDRPFRSTLKANIPQACDCYPDAGGEFDSGVERDCVIGNSTADSACGSCADVFSEQTTESEDMDVQVVLKRLLDGQAWLAGVQRALQEMQLQVAAHVEEQLDKMMIRVEEQTRAHRLGWKLELAAEVHRQLANLPSGQAHGTQQEFGMSPALQRGRAYDPTFASGSRSLSSCGSSVSLLSSCVKGPLSPGRELQASGRASDSAPVQEDTSQTAQGSLEQQEGPAWPSSKSDHIQDSASDVTAMKLPRVFSGMPPVAIGNECGAPMGKAPTQMPEQPGAGESRIWPQPTRPSPAASAAQLSGPTPGFGCQEPDERNPVEDRAQSCSPPGARLPSQSSRTACPGPRLEASLENSCAKLNAALRVPGLALHTVSRAPDAHLQDILAWRRLKSEGQTERD